MAIPYERIVSEDLNRGYGLVPVTMPAGGIAYGHKIGIHSLLDNVLNLRDLGAVGDGATADDAAFAAALAALPPDGGTILGEPGKVYKTTLKLKIERSNVTIDLQGADLLFQPIDMVVNDRAIVIHAGDGTGVSATRNVVGAIALKATGFTASDPALTADLLPNDWLVIEERDPGLGDICIIDWVQVRSVVGAAVTTWNPFRTAFPGVHSGVTFRRVINLVENTHLMNMTVRTTEPVTALVGIAVGICKGTLLENVMSAPTRGNAFFSYRSADLTLQNCRQLRNLGQATEFAATVDLGLYGNLFSTVDAVADTSTLTLDMGTGHFAMIGNKLTNGGNILMQMTNGVHDGCIIGNNFGFCHDVGIGNCVGLASLGSQNVTVIGNEFSGGDGVAAFAVGFGDTSTLTVNIASLGNVIGLNAIRGWAKPYGVIGLSDVYLNVNSANVGSFAIPNPVVLGQVIPFTVPNKNLNFRTTTFLESVIHWEKIGIANWYCGPDEDSFFVGFNVDSDRALDVSITGIVTAKAGLKASPTSDPVIKTNAVLQSIAAVDYTPNPIAAQSVSTFTIAVPGCAAGDLATVAPTNGVGPGANLTWCAFVTAPGVVTVKVSNPTAAPVAPLPSIWSALTQRIA